MYKTYILPWYLTIAVICLLQAIVSPELFAQRLDATNKKLMAEHLVINVNEADEKLLAKHLIGIGKKRAQAIIAYRKKHGNFLTIEDIAKVRGISKSIVERNRSRLRLR